MESLPANITTVTVTGLLTVCIYFIKKILEKFDKLTGDVQSLSEQVAVMHTKFDLELRMVKNQLARENAKLNGHG